MMAKANEQKSANVLVHVIMRLEVPKKGASIDLMFQRLAGSEVSNRAFGIDVAEITILLVGERPGLATGESMSAYIAYESSLSKPESQRTVVSNIHSGGLYPVEAGAQIIHSTEIMLKEKKSRVDLKI